MKIFKTKFLGLALAGLILGACSQTGTYETADLMNEQAVANKAGFNMTPFGMGNENARAYDAASWQESCVTNEESTWFVKTYEHTFDVEEPAKKVKVDVYNTPTQIVYKFTTENTTVKYIQINGEYVVNDQAVSSYTHSVDLSSSWTAGNTIAAVINVFRNNTTGGGGGNKAAFNTSYNLVGICTTTTLSAGTSEPICEDAEFTLTATVSSLGTFEGGIIQILNASNVVVASADVTLANKQVQFSVPTETAGDYTFSARYVRSTPSFRYQGSVSTSTSTVNVIECGVCVYDFETGYVGNTVGANDPGPGNGSNNAWWYAFDIEGPATQNIYQNSTVIGIATYDAVEGTITISFNTGYSLKEGESESVKWYSYADGSLPTAGRPTPGQAPTANKGTNTIIDTNGDRYYVIHLDVQFCNSID